MDPEFREIALRFRGRPVGARRCLRRAWFKLTHRDMGPKIRYLGPEAPEETLIWQDPVPEGTAPSDVAIAAFKEAVLSRG